jgi:tetratricopeptide (TPR) repeat protein
MDEDVRLTFSTPYRNVRPDVKYVGDQLCAECHQTEFASYRHHSMGRSMAPISELVGREDYSSATKNPFESFGLLFKAAQSGEGIQHELILRGDGGQELIHQRRLVQYVVGSSARGRAYLIEDGGRLYQSPVNWYSHAQRWDIAPNIHDRQNDYFLPITQQCVFCHAGHVEPIEGTIGRYATPVFKYGAAIGCERCHGPGELHVHRRQQSDATNGIDDTIVNPANLEPALRDAVCQQCHLPGEARVERRGRKTFDYRPGLPLEAFVSVFVVTPEPRDKKLIGHFEQMLESQCYRKSSGALSCISCHDPHVLPEPKERVASYRQRCAACHGNAGCSLPASDRQSKNGDSCIDCHMPKIRPVDIAHTVMTEHRVLRRPDRPDHETGITRRPLWEGVTLASFFGESEQSPDRDLLRDLGIGLLQIRMPPAHRSLAGQTALFLLDSSLSAAPDDVPALMAKGSAQQWLGQKSQALETYERVLRIAPKNEAALCAAATLADALRRPEAALTYWQSALGLDPDSADIHFGLACVYAGQHDWQRGLHECQVALEAAPMHLEARMLLVRCAMQMDDKNLTRKELSILLAQNPPQKEQLRQVLETLKNP